VERDTNVRKGPSSELPDGSPLTGVLAASLTPLRRDLEIDQATLSDHCRLLLENGCAGIALFGTTGEAVSFTRDERMRALEAVVEAGLPPQRIIVGTGCCAVGDTVELTRHALGIGVAGVLVLPPFYYKNVSDDGLIDAYRRVITETGDARLKLFLYHFPRMTGVPVPMAVIAGLREEFPGIIAGVKDSSGDPATLGALCGHHGDLAVYPGTEILLLAGLRLGSAGCISGSVNVTGAMAAAVYRSWQAGIEDESLQDRLSDVRRVLDQYPLIAALKYLLSRRTGRGDWLRVRPPLRPLPPERAAQLLRKLADIDFPIT
jgi:4-hydroxy-tetrahydrodipicolinate synthase